jgi:hypothetical protein
MVKKVTIKVGRGKHSFSKAIKEYYNMPISQGHHAAISKAVKNAFSDIKKQKIRKGRKKTRKGRKRRVPRRVRAIKSTKSRPSPVMEDIKTAEQQ